MSQTATHPDDMFDNRLARALLRVVVWVLPGLFVVVGGVGSYFLSEILATQKQQGQKLAQVTSDVQVLNAKLDSGVIWRINELERRVNHVEHAQKVP